MTALVPVLPVIPEGWNTLTQPQNSRFAKTYNYFDSSEASSAFQKSVRRGKIEAIQWALELYWCGQRHRTNIWNRILVVAVEDVGPACPKLISHLILLRRHAQPQETGSWSAGHYLALARAVELCVKARKSRLNDWAAHIFDFKDGIPEDMNLSAQQAAQNLVQGLREKEPMACLKWAEFLWSTKETITARYKKAGWLLWTTLEANLQGIAREIFTEVRDLGMSDNWRWQRKTRLLWLHLIMVHCYESVIDKEKSALNKIVEMPIGDLNSPSEGTLIWEIMKTYTRSGIVGVPDYALDKHTSRGKAMGRGLDHFIEVGSVLENRAEELIQIEDIYFNIYRQKVRNIFRGNGSC